jgi:hypothetical protein
MVRTHERQLQRDWLQLKRLEKDVGLRRRHVWLWYVFRMLDERTWIVSAKPIWQSQHLLDRRLLPSSVLEFCKVHQSIQKVLVQLDRHGLEQYGRIFDKDHTVCYGSQPRA